MLVYYPTSYPLSSSSEQKIDLRSWKAGPHDQQHHVSTTVSSSSGVAYATPASNGANTASSTGDVRSAAVGTRVDSNVNTSVTTRTNQHQAIDNTRTGAHTQAIATPAAAAGNTPDIMGEVSGGTDRAARLHQCLMRYLKHRRASVAGNFSHANQTDQAAASTQSSVFSDSNEGEGANKTQQSDLRSEQSAISPAARLNETSDIPILHRKFASNLGKGFGGWAWPLLWSAPSHHRVRYLIIPKSGSATMRYVLAKCKPHGGEPCDLCGRDGEAWHYGAGTTGRGFYGHKNGKLTPQAWEYYSYTFVTEPIKHLIAGFSMAHRLEYKGKNMSPREYQKHFVQFVDSLLDVNKVGYTYTAGERPRHNVHVAPQLGFLYNAASSWSQYRNSVNASGGEGPSRVIEFVGVMSSAHANTDWAQLRKELATRNAGRSGFVPLPKVLGHYTPKHKSYSSLGQYRTVDTMPRTLVRRLCAALYAEYICLGFSFPKACCDDDGRFNVSYVHE